MTFRSHMTWNRCPRKWPIRALSSQNWNLREFSFFNYYYLLFFFHFALLMLTDKNINFSEESDWLNSLNYHRRGKSPNDDKATGPEKLIGELFKYSLHKITSFLLPCLFVHRSWWAPTFSSPSETYAIPCLSFENSCWKPCLPWCFWTSACCPVCHLYQGAKTIILHLIYSLLE